LVVDCNDYDIIVFMYVVQIVLILFIGHRKSDD
jgi:hypothetical protein